MRIAVGTTSEQKLGYLREVLTGLMLEFELLPLDIKSGVSDQPKTNLETKRGSINRARGALQESDDTDLAIGIEVGYHPNKSGDYKIFCWATLIDRNDRIVSTKSHSLLLPEFHQDILKADKNLGDYVREYIDGISHPSIRYMGEIIRNRKPFIQTAIELAFFEYWLGENGN